MAINWLSVGLGLAGIGYIISPIDAIPDFIPGIGQIDDGVVAAASGLLILGGLEGNKPKKSLGI